MTDARKSVRINIRNSVSQYSVMSQTPKTNMHTSKTLSNETKPKTPKSILLNTSNQNQMNKNNSILNKKFSKNIFKDPHVSQEQAFLKQRLSKPYSDKSYSTQFIKDQLIKQYPKQFSQSHQQNNLYNTQQITSPTHKSSISYPQLPQQQQLSQRQMEYTSSLNEYQDQQQQNFMPQFSSDSLNKCIKKIKDIPVKPIIELDKSLLKNRKFRESSFQLHKNTQIGINKILRPEMRGVTDLKRMMKSLPPDRVDKILKKLSILKEDNDAELKVNVNTELVYERLMVEKLKKRETDYNINYIQDLLNKYKQDQIHRITSFQIPIPRENKQMFKMNNKSLKQLNMIDNKKQQQSKLIQSQQKLQSQNTINLQQQQHLQQQNNNKKSIPYIRQNEYQKIYKSQQKPIIDQVIYSQNQQQFQYQYQQEQDHTIISKQNLLDLDPIYCQQDTREILQKSLLIVPRKQKKSKNNNNNGNNQQDDQSSSSSGESEPIWYRNYKNYNYDFDPLNTTQSNDDNNI